MSVARVGRTPKWCSDSCRHRAWETRRAAASGDRPVRVVDRSIEVAVPVVERVVERVEVPVLPSGPAWPAALAELACQLDTGKVYDRDLAALATSLEQVLLALHRRPAARRLLH